MNSILTVLDTIIRILRPTVFVLAALVGIAATLSWAARTRRISPFSAIARFVRERIDPLFRPMEQRVIRAGGMPSAAPWWTLAAVAIIGLLLIAFLDFLLGQLVVLSTVSRGGAKGIVLLLISWTFGFIKIAIIARVISSWVGGGPYSKWWRWSYVVSDPILRPLRNVLPALGPIDISPIVAYFGLTLLESLVLNIVA